MPMGFHTMHAKLALQTHSGAENHPLHYAWLGMFTSHTTGSANVLQV